jgi:hypothetical protein
MTSPLRPQAASKHWKTLSSSFTLKVRPRVAPRWSGQQPGRQTHVVEDAGHRQLTFDVGKIGKAALTARRPIRYAVGTGRGDHLPRRRCVRPVARGLVVFGRRRVTVVLFA